MSTMEQERRPVTEPFTVHHDPEQPPALVHTGGELDELLLRVTAMALDEDTPVLLEIVTPDRRRRLYVGLGESEYSVLLHHDDTTGEIRASRGLPVPYDAGFDHAGQWSPAPVDSAVPIADARDAAREFLTSGGRLPSGVHWQEPRYDG